MSNPAPPAAGGISRSSESLRVVIFLLALLALAAVVVARGVALSGGELWDAHGEQRWSYFGWRRPRALEELEALAPRVPPGARVLLALAPGEDAEWWKVMATYALPRQRVVAAVSSSRGGLPPHDAVILAGPDGRTVLAKGPREARRRGPSARDGSEGAAAAARSAADGGPGRLALGTLLVAAAGLALAPDRAVRGALPRLALGGTLSLSVLAPAAVAVGLSGAPFGAAAVVLLAVATAAVGLALRGRGAKADATSDPAARPVSALVLPTWVTALASLTLAAAVALVAAKSWVMPLWTWDHHAAWGLKARLLFTDVGIDPFQSELVATTPTYPLGLPVGWRALVLGAVPTRSAFRLMHALAAMALLLVFHGAVHARTGSRALAATLAAWVALSPLFWDTEAVGSADLPFGLTLLVAGALLLATGPGTAVAAGIALAALPWLKQEGTAAAAAVLVAVAVAGIGARGVVSAGWRRLATAVGIAAAGIAAAAIVRFGWLPAGGPGDFVTPGWTVRLHDRIGSAGVLLREAGRELMFPDWIGLWPLIAVGTVCAAVLRHRRALALLCAVWALQLVYVSVFFVTYLDPLAHLASAYYRISAALVPLGLLGLAELAVPVSETRACAAASPPGAPPKRAPAPHPG